jgi:hypothetical protein
LICFLQRVGYRQARIVEDDFFGDEMLLYNAQLSLHIETKLSSRGGKKPFYLFFVDKKAGIVDISILQIEQGKLP